MKSYDPSKPYKDSILKAIQETWDTPYLSVEQGLYPIFQRKFSHPEIDHTDGIGTKGLYHWQARTFKEAVQDALAMNLNDLALARAVPFKLQNHLTLPADDEHAIREIIHSLVEECKKRSIAITGGETSIHENQPGMDLSITMSGFIGAVKENRFQQGDVLFGIKSSGLHSNGFTKIRKLFGETLRDEFTVPTKIYDEEIRALAKVVDIHGMIHITGGAFSKLKDIAKDVNVFFVHNEYLLPQDIFFEIYKRGVLDEEIYKTFNCGIGFVFSVGKHDASKIPHEFEVQRIGEVVPGNGGIIIESAFSDQTIRF